MLVPGLLLAAAAAVGLQAVRVAAQNNTWCGKVYDGSPQIIPGGFLAEPSLSPVPLLDVRVASRHSIYVGSEKTVEFIVDAALSPYHGSAYYGDNTMVTKEQLAADRLRFTIAVQDRVVVAGDVRVNTTDNLFGWDVDRLAPSATAYKVTLTGTTTMSGVDGNVANFTASTELFYLPEKRDGSVVKVDRLHGSLLYRNNNTDGAFRPFFPYGYYGTYSGYFNTTGNPTAYAALGFNALNPVTDYADGDMTYTIDEMDGLDHMLFQYDMRNSYRNLTAVAEQVPRVKDHPSLLTWYTADEPDGWGYALDSTTQAYDLIVSLDKYHPVALVLGCQNHYFDRHSAGADILMEDAYPVGINTTYSTKWNTTVNITYGDCGCDNCAGGSANLSNVPARLDDFGRYAEWLGGPAVRKPVWAVPQAFSGEGYWARDPTADEAWATDLLALNHGAKGRLAWIYPPSDALIDASARLARVVTVAPVVDFLTGANPVLLLDGSSGADGALDVALWDGGHASRGVLVSVVNPVGAPATGPVRITLPDGLRVSMIDSKPWGNVDWAVDGSVLEARDGLPGLSASLIVLK